jgi:hypothetical protein
MAVSDRQRPPSHAAGVSPVETDRRLIVAWRLSFVIAQRRDFSPLANAQRDT